jgi:hypothetical protein
MDIDSIDKNFKERKICIFSKNKNATCKSKEQRYIEDLPFCIKHEKEQKKRKRFIDEEKKNFFLDLVKKLKERKKRKLNCFFIFFL